MTAGSGSLYDIFSGARFFFSFFFLAQKYWIRFHNWTPCVNFPKKLNNMLQPTVYTGRSMHATFKLKPARSQNASAIGASPTSPT